MNSSRPLALAFAGALVSAGLLVAPASAEEPVTTTSATTPAPSPKVSTFTTKKGHKVTVTLPTAADGGYGWVITRGARSGKFVVLSKKVRSPEFDGAVGRPAKTVFVLRATERGSVLITFTQRREFDKSDVVQRYRLRLVIR